MDIKGYISSFSRTSIFVYTCIVMHVVYVYMALLCHVARTPTMEDLNSLHTAQSYQRCWVYTRVSVAELVRAVALTDSCRWFLTVWSVVKTPHGLDFNV